MEQRESFISAYAPLIVVGLLIAVIALFLPMSRKGFSIHDTCFKGPVTQTLATTGGPREAEVSLEMTLESPAAFKYRNSPIERLRGATMPMRWKLTIEGMNGATLPCFQEGPRVCTFKIGASVDDRLAVSASGCAPSAGNSLVCGGRVAMTPHLFYDVALADSPVTLEE
ncbi:MAG: hypothetical protein HYU52_01340 [Acidobacteria bacterium]|nr:hypothetical protein [Acidobacteriota bacterium]